MQNNSENIKHITYTLNLEDDKDYERVKKSFLVNSMGDENIYNVIARENSEVDWYFRNLLIEKDVEKVVKKFGRKFTSWVNPLWGKRYNSILSPKDVWISNENREIEAPENYEELLEGPVKERYYFDEFGKRQKNDWYVKDLEERRIENESTRFGLEA